MCVTEELHPTKVKLGFALGELPTSASSGDCHELLANPFIEQLQVVLAQSSQSSNDTVNSNENSTEHDDDDDYPKTPLSVSWKPLLDAIAASPSCLTHLSISSAFDAVGTHAMKLSELTHVLQNNPKLQELHLDSIGFWIDDDDDDDDRQDLFAKLQDAVHQHEYLRSIRFHNIYFCQQRRTDSWLLYSRIITALVAGDDSNTLRTFDFSTATRYFSRPILTLTALQTLWSHRTITSLTLKHFNLWGAGSAQHCNASLRANHTLTHLSLHSCVFAAAANDGATSSLLVGLDQNTTLRHLHLVDCMLHLEAAGLTQALAVNQALQSLSLDHSRMGFDVVSHNANLGRVLRALSCRDTTITATTTTTTIKNNNPNNKKKKSLSELSVQYLLERNVNATNDDDDDDDSNNNENTATAAAKAFLHALLELVQQNTKLTRVQFLNHHYDDTTDTDTDTTDTTPHNNNDNFFSSLDMLQDIVKGIQVTTALNRVGYWDLCPTKSSHHQWTEVMSRAGNDDNNDDDNNNNAVATLYHIVRDNPLVCRER